MKFIITMLFVLSPVLSLAGQFAAKCIPQVDSCSYYLCEEKNHPCGPKGYPLGFGFKICQIFLNSEQNYSTEARNWLRKVRVCLMQEFPEADDSVTRTCGEIKTTSFHSHVGCYISTGFCELSIAEQMQIFWPMRGSLIYTEVLRDAYSIAQVCAFRTTLNPEALSALR
ncbi:MAG TPA: hypothetical protein VIG33_05385 [Pseudobdellovibrionaceae bacterium]